MAGSLGALGTALVGLVVLQGRIGEPLVHLSFDLLFAFAARHSSNAVTIIKMDALAHRELHQEWGREKWDRALHAQLLDRLRADGAPLVVFDVVFAERGDPRTNAVLAKAMRDHGAVVIAGELATLDHPGIAAATVVNKPSPELRDAAAGWGLADFVLDHDGAVRRHPTGTQDYPSLAWVAAERAQASFVRDAASRFAEHWLRYYPPRGAITNLSYHVALNLAPGFFRGRIVFIGGGPGTRFAGEEADEFRTPFTTLQDVWMSGVELTATTFLNLLNGDCLRRWPIIGELALVLFTGFVFGFGLVCVRPWTGLALAAAGMLGTGLLASLLFDRWNVWFPWLVVAGAQIPLAFVSAVFVSVARTPSARRWEGALAPAPVAIHAPAVETAVHADASEQAGSGLTRRDRDVAAPRLPPTALPATCVGAPPVAGHTLLRSIGRGAYGEVWLARDVIGCFHAVKVISRRSFASDSPYEREFRGIQKFTPISRSHPGFVHILHVDRDDGAGHFYYVMEAADDERSGQRIDPATYAPRNLSRELSRRGRLPLEECLDLSLALAAALEHLHRQQLIHRDIKPSNIIFVNGAPKLADIGLVTDLRQDGRDVTYVGTQGYLAPEGPGTAGADVYSLGKVIYEAAIGGGPTRFPELPTTLIQTPAAMEPLLDLNAILLKACAPQPAERYQTAAELQADLLRLQDRIRAPARSEGHAKL